MLSCLIYRAFAFYVLCLFLIATSFLVNKDEYITAVACMESARVSVDSYYLPLRDVS